MGCRDALNELKRKSIHMIPGFAAIPVVVWLGREWGIAISALFLALYSLNELHLKGLIKRRIPIATQTFEIMARKEEIEKRTFLGTVLFWSSTLALIALLPPAKAAAAVMVSSFGDAAAAVVGRLVGGPRLPWTRKTIAGSLAMFAISLLCIYVNGLPLTTCVITSALSTLAEALTKVSILDELTVPLTAGVSLALF
ncbi:MAG: hypothetical protein GXO32_01575 [Crenarchaeota archaeon]|nr:hypothetical protein [Thermoproteota archaeon]